MTITDRLRRALGITTVPDTYSQNPTLKEVQQTVFKTGRQSIEFDDTYQAGYKFLPRRVYDNFDATAIFESKQLTYAQILAILPDLDPDVSMALNNMLRLSNTDMSVKVYKGLKTEVIDQAAQNNVDTFLKGINRHYGGLKNLINQLNMSAYLQGAMSIEAVLDEKNKTVIDFAPINPFSIHFLHVGDNSDLSPTQYQLKPAQGRAIINANYVVMNPLTFWYSPVDPAIGDPYGRPPAGPAIGDVMFMMRIMYDLRKVIHNQGWPRIDVTVITEMIKNMAPDAIKNDANKYVAFINEQVNKIVTAYSDLKPDDTFVHNDGVKVEMVGETSRGALMDPSALLLSIERRIIRGLKQLPMLMGSNEGTTETHGTVQYEIYTKTIESFQNLVENILAEALELKLRMDGIQATVVVEFDKVRSSQRLLDAQAYQLEIQNQVALVDKGWISNDEASLEITGSEPFMDPDEMTEDEPDPEDPTDNPPSSSDPADPSEIDPTKGAEADSKKSATKNSYIYKMHHAMPPLQRGMKDRKHEKTLAGQEKRYLSIHKKFHKSVAKKFQEVQQLFPARSLLENILSTYPRAEQNMLKMKRAPIDTNSPVYNTIQDIVGKFFQGDDVQKITNSLSQEGATLLIAAFENYSQNVLIRLSAKDPKFSYADFKLSDKGVEDLIKRRAEFFPTSSFETASQDIARTVMRGYQDNKGISEISADLKAKFAELKTSRANLIANMELNWATSRGTLITMQRNGVKEKAWQTVNDNKVREDHMANQDEGPIPVDGYFSGTGDDAPPADFNCRCTIYEVVDENWLAPDDIWTGDTTGDSTDISSLLDEKNLSRPAHQTAIEDALNSGNPEKAQKLVDAMDDSDPYKSSMQSMLDMLK